MVEQNIKVIRVQQSVFRALREEILRVSDDVLIQRGRGRNEYGETRILAATGTTGFLPGGGNGARIAAKNTSLKAADINTEL